MADDWHNIALRFGLYVGLAALFGISLFGFYGQRLSASFLSFGRRFTSVLLVLAAVDIVFSACAILVTAKAMSGAETYSELTTHIVGMVITGTEMGVAWLVRMGVLLAFLILASASIQRRPQFGLLSVLSAISLATLAWSGHAVMHDGVARLSHLASDITHLWAAGAWIGALFCLIMLASMNPASSPDAVEVLSQTSSGFATVGTIIVVLLVITGTVNYLFIAGPTIRTLIDTQYGLLLVVKLILFVGMLLLAAANRYLFSPKVELAIKAGNGAKASQLLRISLLTETSLALVVIACVAWLGVLSPIVATQAR
ncbi:copper homeostasis membrane protein CopD [Oxalicibacterium faecigallinarum]|uniref:Copper resistance protein CopD n=1 Tax=Oxalicibacterium faecigallinarum TaxID=573741 RepID=A0A8J3ANM3_9BURK|nr:copper homeostasis membrane protein CopD [Oxalicibacterium faecigallinarum]GGI16949.1 copper resistance protein CopD [Oxalicibacterium faecigallinarum]